MRGGTGTECWLTALLRLLAVFDVALQRIILGVEGVCFANKMNGSGVLEG